MTWQPSMTWEVAQSRARIIQNIRSFFHSRAVIEVETPSIAQETTTDVYIDAFSTKYNFLSEGEREYFLQTSPEFAMKRLLSSGYGSIFQICKAFRHEPSGRFHNAEFTILEWYRLGFDQEQLIDEVDTLLSKILATPQSLRISYQNVFIEHTRLDPLTVNIEQCLSFIAKVNKSANWLSEANDIDTLLQFIFSECIEPKIGLQAPCFVYNFPASQASLARIDEHDERVANRFECYYQGVELVNGFYELTDAQAQLARFENDNFLRESKGFEKRDIDQRFIDALSDGLPECSGVALGIDRLIMLALKADHIREVISFPIENA